jgi:ABC-type glycerol-3-phosphate transport system substrate-binding protein
MLSKGYLEKLHPIVRVTGTDIKGNFWMLAHEWEVNGMTYYNAKILRDAGVRIPEWDTIWSWDEAREILKKVADPSKGRAGLTFRYPRNDKVLEFWLPLVWQEGAEIVKYENNKPKMDLGEPAVRAMAFFHDLVKNDKTIPSGVMGTTTDSELAAFLDGKTAFVREGPWFADLILRAGRKDLEWGVMHPWKGKRTVAPIEAVGWAMSSTAKNKEAAWEVMWHLTASKGMVSYNKKGRMLPTTLENLADPAFQTKDDWFHVQQLAIKSGRPYPNHPMVYAFGNNVIPEITHMMIEGKISPRDTIRALEKEGTYMMRDFE